MEEIENLMQEKERLLRKYHCNTIAEVIQLLQKILAEKALQTNSSNQTSPPI